MTIVAEKKTGTWLITAVQNVNASADVRSPEAHDQQEGSDHDDRSRR
jgi:hypothetical protein